MAWERVLLYEPGLIASGDCSNYQYYCVKYGSTEGQVALSNSTSDACGTLMNDPANGEVANVALIGVAKAVAGATITKGDRLVSGTGYKAIPTTTDTDKYFGEALENAATNDVFSYLVAHGLYAG